MRNLHPSAPIPTDSTPSKPRLIASDDIGITLRVQPSADLTPRHKGILLYPDRDYTFVARRIYESKVFCAICGHEEQAQTLVLLRDDTTGHTLEVGLNCLERLYNWDRSQIDAVCTTVGAVRRKLDRTLGQSAVSVAAHLERVRRLVQIHVPHSEALQAELEALKTLPSLHTNQTRRIALLHDLAGVQHEARAAPTLLRDRIEALEGHPRWLNGGDRPATAVSAELRTQLEQGRIENGTALTWIKLLHQARNWKHEGSALVRPWEHGDQETYLLALKVALRAEVELDEFGTCAWKGTHQWEDQLSPKKGLRHQTFAIEVDDITHIKMRFRNFARWSEQEHRPIFAEGTRTLHTTVGTENERYRDDMGQWQTRMIAGRKVSYRILGVALCERYFGAYPLWHRYGDKKVLERFTFPEALERPEAEPRSTHGPLEGAAPHEA